MSDILLAGFYFLCRIEESHLLRVRRGRAEMWEGKRDREGIKFEMVVICPLLPAECSLLACLLFST